MSDNEDQHIRNFDEVKVDVNKNKRNLLLQQNQMKKVSEKLESLYQMAQEMTNNDEFATQMEQIQKLVSMSNSTVIESMAGK